MLFAKSIQAKDYLYVLSIANIRKGSSLIISLKCIFIGNSNIYIKVERIV